VTQQKKREFYSKVVVFVFSKPDFFNKRIIKAPLLLLLFDDDAFRRSTRRSKWYA
tara:strand:+ start:2210 stop:2374 length:165 start_codon:yes stop_codon:yes gene_type:complete